MDDMEEYLRRSVGILTPIERADKEYKEQATGYFREQRELIAEQKRYTTTIKWATIVMAGATVIMAVFMALQYFIPITQPQTVSIPPVETHETPAMQQSQAPQQQK